MGNPKTDATLNGSQQLVLLAIGQRLVDGRSLPTVRDLVVEACMSSTSVVNYTLRRLSTLGYLDLTQSQEARGLRLTDAGHEWLATRGVITPQRARQQLEAAARAVVDSPTQAHVAALADVLEAVAA